jgi:hypothetical protein
MTIVIPSMGRCGSTALYFAIRASVPPHAGRFVHKLSTAIIEDGEIIKTHDKAPETIPNNWKVIYLHGDKDAIYKSVLNQPTEWKKQHFIHFDKQFINNEESVIFGDALGLDSNYESWKKHGNVLCIHYENLFESEGIISEYLGVQITLPKRIERTTK